MTQIRKYTNKIYIIKKIIELSKVPTRLFKFPRILKNLFIIMCHVETNLNKKNKVINLEEVETGILINLS